MATPDHELALAQDVANFKTKHPTVPTGDQKAPFTAKDYRDLRRFFKHSTSEEIRQWIVSAMYANRIHTEEAMQKHGDALRDEYAEEIRKANFKKKEAVQRRNQIAADLTILAQYCALPWYMRIFKKPPVL